MTLRFASAALASSLSMLACAGPAPTPVTPVPAPAPSPSVVDVPRPAPDAAPVVRDLCAAGSGGKSATLAEMASATVAAVCVRGNAHVATATLVGALPTKVGAPFDAAVVVRDIKALYDLGSIEDVQVRAGLSDAGVVVTYLVREKVRLANVKVDKAGPLTAAEVQEATAMGEWLDLAKVRESADRLSGAYAKHGRRDAHVVFEVASAGPDGAVVTFKLEEPAR